MSLWCKWMGWAKVLGPFGALGDDLRAAHIAQHAAAWTVPADERQLRNFLPPNRRLSDLAAWVDLNPIT